MTKVIKDTFGLSPQGKEVSRFTLVNGPLELDVITWGATITSLKLEGEDVVLGFDDMKGYTGGKNPYFGAGVGRVANRVADATFSLDGKTYTLAKGYPGDIIYNVRYSLDSEGGVRIDFSAMVTKPTPVDLANHVYFNLGGHQSGKEGLDEHVMRMAADSITPVTEKLIPTGSIGSVAGSVFDLRTPTRLGDVLSLCPGGENNGFDHNFVLSN